MTTRLAKVDSKGRTVVCRADLSVWSVEVVRAAAYTLTDRAFAFIDEAPRNRVQVILQSKEEAGLDALRALAAAFSAELETQSLRQRLAKEGLPIREFVVEQAVRMANRPAAPAPASAEAELTAEQKAEIERLIAEVEAEIKEGSKDRAKSDPKNIAAAWEEKHGRRGGPSGS